jgi:uncharacterized membrane protein
MRILALVLLVFYSIILYYLLRLEQTGCKCALDWRRNYIIGMFVLFILVAIFSPMRKLTGGLQLLFIAVFIGLVMANIVIVFDYVNYLKKEKCKCSESHLRNLMQLVTIIHAFGAGFGLLFLFYAVSYFLKYKSVPEFIETPRSKK